MPLLLRVRVAATVVLAPLLITVCAQPGRAQTSEREKGVAYPSTKGGVPQPAPLGRRPGGMAPPMAPGTGTLLDASRGPVQYDAQRFIGYVNYLAQNLPEELALVSVRQEGSPEMGAETVGFRYRGRAYVNPLAARLVTRAIACFGSLRAEVYQEFFPDHRSHRYEVSYPVGIAFWMPRSGSLRFSRPRM